MPTLGWVDLSTWVQYLEVSGFIPRTVTIIAISQDWDRSNIVYVVCQVLLCFGMLVAIGSKADRYSCLSRSTAETDT